MKILFDETQKERGRIFSNFSILESDLTEAGHKIAVLDTFPIKYSSINNADVLVFLCPDGSKLYGHEIKNILRFVEEGNILMVFSNAGGDKGLNTNLNSLLKHFGVELIPNQIFDFQNFDFQQESCPVVTKIYPHEITENIKELTYCSGCSLHINNEVIELARTSNTSDPPSATIMALAQYGLGWVFVCGSHIIFSNKKAGISNRDNRQLARNLFSWAEKEKKERISQKAMDIEIESKQKEVNIEEQETEETEQETEETEQAKYSAQSKLEKEERKEKEPTSTTLLSKPEKLSESDISSILLKIKEIEAEVESYNVDQSYKDIIIADLARKKGIDYAMVQRYLQMKKEELEEESLDMLDSAVPAKTAQTMMTEKPETEALSLSRELEPEPFFEEPKGKELSELKPAKSLMKEKREEGKTFDTENDLVAQAILTELKAIRKNIEQLNSTILKLLEKEEKQNHS